MKRIKYFFAALLISLAVAVAANVCYSANPLAVAAILFALSFILPAPNENAFNVVQTFGQRIIFENAKALLEAAKVPLETAILTQSYLRLEQLMNTTQTNVQFPVTITQGTGAPFNTERRLQLQDSFVASEIGMFLFAPSSATATNSHLYSYPSFFTFTGAGVASSAQQTYHGYLTLSVNNQVIVPFWDVQRSYCVNQTQNLAAIAAASPDDQLSGRDDVFYPTEPNWVFVGSKNNVLTLVMQNALTAILANSRWVVYMRGVLAQNSTSVQ